MLAPRGQAPSLVNSSNSWVGQPSNKYLPNKCVFIPFFKDAGSARRVAGARGYDSACAFHYIMPISTAVKEKGVHGARFTSGSSL